jgi:hypothetical protein
MAKLDIDLDFDFGFTTSSEEEGQCTMPSCLYLQT